MQAVQADTAHSRAQAHALAMRQLEALRAANEQARLTWRGIVE
jgi:hypothetical protein